jgi:arylformamidase
MGKGCRALERGNQLMQAVSEYYERQYSNRLSIPDAAEYNLRAEAHSREVRATLPCHLNVAYGESLRECIDIFPAAERDAPLLVFIHGGYWRSRDKSEFSFIAGPFVAAGITVAFPGYDLAPNVTVETIVRQVLSAHAWLYRRAREYNADPARMYVSGHSSGGHLAAMMCAARWDRYDADLPADMIKGALAVSGLYDLAPILETSLNAQIRLNARSARKVSPLSYFPPRSVPLYTATGALESDEFKRQAKVIAEAWPHCFARHLEVPGCHHLSVLEALGQPGSALCEAALDMVLSRDS